METHISLSIEFRYKETNKITKIVDLKVMVMKGNPHSPKTKNPSLTIRCSLLSCQGHPFF